MWCALESELARQTRFFLKEKISDNMVGKRNKREYIMGETAQHVRKLAVNHG